MNNFDDLKEWADKIALKHTIKILQDSGLSKEKIIDELNLTEKEYSQTLKQ